MSVLLGTSTGRVYAYALGSGKVTATRGECVLGGGVVGVDWLPQKGPSQQPNSLIYATKKGDLHLASLDDELKSTGLPGLSPGCVAMTRTHQTVATGGSGGEVQVCSVNFEEDQEMYTVETHSPQPLSFPGLTSLTFDRHSNTRLAVLGKGRPPCVLDVVKGAVEWEGRNVPADELQLPIPMLDHAGVFSEEGHMLTVSTAHGKVRMYDFRVNKRRPVKDVQVDRHALWSVQARESDVLVGSNVGEVFRLEPRKDLGLLRKYNQAHGAVTSLALSDSGDLFCSASLDRHLRVYSLRSDELLREEFLFQKLECCTFSPGHIDLDLAQLEEEEVAEEEEELKPQLFRDQLQKAGGKLTHNFIKLKYEKRNVIPAVGI